jgi:hypothetical protein
MEIQKYDMKGGKILSKMVGAKKERCMGKPHIFP